MGTIFVMVGHELREQAFQVGFIECDDVIQQVPAATSYPALRDPVLPRVFSEALNFDPRGRCRCSPPYPRA